MFAIIFGIALAGFAVYACLPSGLGWSEEVIFFLKGAAPVASAFVALIAILIGIADLKDRREARIEEEEAMRAEMEDSKKNV